MIVITMVIQPEFHWACKANIKANKILEMAMLTNAFRNKSFYF